jgi:hypothetical protein
LKANRAAQFTTANMAGAIIDIEPGFVGWSFRRFAPRVASGCIDRMGTINGKTLSAPPCSMVSTRDAQFEYVWISPEDPMPDVCVCCGMFTDRRVPIKHVEFVQKPSDEAEGCGSVLLEVFLHLALGPIGWLVSIMIHGKENQDGTRTVKEKLKIKLAQCPLCQGEFSPEVFDSKLFPTRLMFQVHPRFKDRLMEEQAKVKSIEENGDFGQSRFGKPF